METHEIEEFLYFEFDEPDPHRLSLQDRQIAYMRLRHRLIEKDLTPDEYTRTLIRIGEYLEL